MPASQCEWNRSAHVLDLVSSGMIHSAPSSAISPFSSSTDHTLPPDAFRASSTSRRTRRRSASAPPRVRRSPAPTTTTFADRIHRTGCPRWRADPRPCVARRACGTHAVRLNRRSVRRPYTRRRLFRWHPTTSAPDERDETSSRRAARRSPSPASPRDPGRVLQAGHDPERRASSPGSARSRSRPRATPSRCR